MSLCVCVWLYNVSDLDIIHKFEIYCLAMCHIFFLSSYKYFWLYVNIFLMKSKEKKGRYKQRISQQMDKRQQNRWIKTNFDWNIHWMCVCVLVSIVDFVFILLFVMHTTVLFRFITVNIKFIIIFMNFISIEYFIFMMWAYSMLCICLMIRIKDHLNSYLLCIFVWFTTKLNFFLIESFTTCYFLCLSNIWIRLNIEL